MTDVFNIDFEVEGFRKNNLDWRKFRDTYNKVSATKLERGIKPLPLSLLLKLFGPQKVLNTYVSTRHSTNELDYTTDLPSVYKDLDMKPSADKDSALTKTLDFPGNGFIITNSEDGHETTSKPQPKTLKRDALPVRPAFQRNARVPGRYFPKPSSSTDEHLSQSLSFYESSNVRDNRPRTLTPRSIHSHTPSTGSRGLTGHSSRQSRASSRIVRGPMCKATDTLSSNPGRSNTWSGMNTRNVPALHTNGYSASRRDDDNHDARQELFSVSFLGDDRPSTNGSGFYESNSDFPGDFYAAGKRLRYSARQVSFPKSGPDFSAVLQGRPKTLHPRDLCESMDAQLIDREPRSRTHVGFVDDDT